MADDADMRNELSDMQQRADQLADEVRAQTALLTPENHFVNHSRPLQVLARRLADATEADLSLLWQF